jgi:hypothetical protein
LLKSADFVLVTFGALDGGNAQIVLKNSNFRIDHNLDDR